MSRWFVVSLALFALGAIDIFTGRDGSAFIAAGIIALAFADEEREYEDMDDDEY